MLHQLQTGAGYDKVDIDACTQLGIWAANAAGVNAQAVAEHVMALMLSYYKNIPYLDSFMVFDMNVLVHARQAGVQPDSYVQMTDFDNLVSASDVVTVHASLNPQTKQLIDQEVFKKMKNTALFINTARGGIVNENDLIAALKNRTI
ncbi:hypothetical protein LBW89_19640 [Paenibacillus sp. alder61]|uniref:2-hydroxyacid dehydrogenase n=1 Tax=Paenibacillus TaxID=44249 RepID=UPI001B865268|nr:MULTISPECIES: NAD(P)-dependent oxidoreductase [Paenibacillus]MCA1295228.1 hypothetical protein [Paenibacillus sp. alder61]